MTPRVLLIAALAVVLAGVSCRRAAPEPQPSASEPRVVQPGAPGQPSRDLPAGTRAATPPAATPADIAFMQGMIHHHAQAVEMVALLKTRTPHDDMQRLGARIDISQRDEIKMMQTWLADHGAAAPMDHGHGRMMINGAMMPAMPGMLTPAQMATLEAAKGSAFDRLFLTGMIQHHEGALVMVRDLQATPGAAQEPGVFDFISHVDADQRMEIARMQRLLLELK